MAMCRRSRASWCSSAAHSSACGSPTCRPSRSTHATSRICLLAQIFQSTACNAAHSIEQRQAKWILDTINRRDDQDLPLTHAQLAAMVGIGRNYASRLLQVFREQGLIETRRGGMRITDQAGLERRACQCHNAVKQHFARVLLGVYPNVAPAT